MQASCVGLRTVVAESYVAGHSRANNNNGVTELERCLAKPVKDTDAATPKLCVACAESSICALKTFFAPFVLKGKVASAGTSGPRTKHIELNGE